MSLADRLKEAISDAGISQASLARKAGVSHAAINKITLGNAKGTTKIIEIADALGVSALWLQTGTGPKREKPDDESSEEVAAPAPLDDDEVMIPIVDGIEYVGLDGRITADAKQLGHLRVKKQAIRDYGSNSDPANIIAIAMSDNSMSPRLPEGSTPLIDTSDKRITDGKVYAIDQDGWKRIKAIYRTGRDKLTLRSFDSESFPDEIVNIDDIQIIGRIFVSVVPF